MRLVAFMIQHYFSVPYDNFTAKVMSAISLFEVVDAKKEDIKKVNWIKNNTHDDVLVSMWKLDKSLNRDKGEFNTVSNKRTYFKNEYTEEEELNSEHKVTLDDHQTYHYLCEAMNNIHKIVSRNIKGYKEEMKFDDLPDEEQNELEF